MSEVTVTLKGAAGYDAPWIVTRGETPEEVRETLANLAGLQDQEGLSLLDVTTNAHMAFSSTYTAVSSLSASVIPSGKGKGWGSKPEAAAEPKKEEVSPADALIERLTSAASVKDLQQLYRKHKDLFENDDVMAAYKTRGQALSK